MVMGVLQWFDHCALDNELSFSLDTLLVIIEGLYFFIKPSFELFRKDQDISLDNRHRFRGWSLWSFLSLFLSNKVIVSVDFKLISLLNLTDVGCSRFDWFSGWDQKSSKEKFKNSSSQLNDSLLFVDSCWLNFLLQVSIEQSLFFINKEENKEMQVFELESLLLASIELSLEDRNASVELKENICVLSFEVFQERVIGLEQNSWRVLNIVCTFFRPIVSIFDDDLIERVSALLFYVALQFVVDVDTLLDVFYVLYQLLYLWYTTFFLDLFDEVFLKGYNLTHLQIFWKLNIL